MSNDLFPALAGLKWNVKLGAERSTLIQKAAAPGYETRISLGPDAISHFECAYEFLREVVTGIDNQPTGVNELRKLLGFFRMHADFDSFLLSLPTLTQNPDTAPSKGSRLRQTPMASLR